MSSSLIAMGIFRLYIFSWLVWYILPLFGGQEGEVKFHTEIVQEKKNAQWDKSDKIQLNLNAESLWCQ